MIAMTVNDMKNSFFVVGIGASAGGQAALKEFLKNMPANMNAAFVVVTHLTRDYKTNLHTILSGYTSMPVSLVKHGEQLQPGRIYVMPENSEVTVWDGRLFLEPRANTPVNKAVDTFFESLARDMGEMAIAVVLSGGGNDGSVGVQHIHRHGGRVFVQAPQSSPATGMPDASIAADHPVAVEDPAILAKSIADCIESLVRSERI
jgi:chemotaxis response regulator CheB